MITLPVKGSILLLNMVHEVLLFYPYIIMDLIQALVFNPLMSERILLLKADDDFKLEIVEEIFASWLRN